MRFIHIANHAARDESTAAKGLRFLTEYLERRPEAAIR